MAPIKRGKKYEVKLKNGKKYEVKMKDALEGRPNKRRLA
jgi:hypothetical protein